MAFTLATRDAVQVMQQAGKPTAANEVHEAPKDISRRPVADVTGAIQHAMAALECVAREVDNSTDTLGKIIGRLGLPGAAPCGAAQTMGVFFVAGPAYRRWKRSDLRGSGACGDNGLGGQRLPFVASGAGHASLMAAAPRIGWAED
ncbi:hypothetical protein [Sphingomonas abaci]|uniref:Uncharacterized protein n=1 Tax=Sphingomonas abaci TaxID=237611 RepID=A0A7W7AGV1_9SPHN|nr:hypothetical protein [Sphingomonas abaci]MBB4616750.1 hypothetical protein [Sphingomonas abaci]